MKIFMNTSEIVMIYEHTSMDAFSSLFAYIYVRKNSQSRNNLSIVHIRIEKDYHVLY